MACFARATVIRQSTQRLKTGGRFLALYRLLAQHGFGYPAQRRRLLNRPPASDVVANTAACAC